MDMENSKNALSERSSAGYDVRWIPSMFGVQHCRQEKIQGKDEGIED